MAWELILLWYISPSLISLQFDPSSDPSSKNIEFNGFCPKGYLAWEYPTNRLLQRLPLGKYSAACILIWGMILSCFAAVKNYPGAIAIRFMLGVFEAAVTPGFALLTSQVRTLFLCLLQTHYHLPQSLENAQPS